eukprot:GHRR01024729.1.p1 GENE.GHRR01024729.1~~GHRR01024729.1.p1  ORF type:complete len:243 (+),score=69.46 GHRR01024729.1:202-930(+)
MLFDGQNIASDGTVPFRTGERVSFSYLITSKFVGESARLGILRDGQCLTVDVTLSRPGVLIPAHLSNRDPSYFLVSGLVFTVACEPYLESEYGADWMSEAPVKLLDRLYTGMPSAAGEQVVVLGQVLADEATLGYEDICNVQVVLFNGTPVLNLQHLAQLVTSCQEDHLRFDLEYHETVIINRQQAVTGTAEVLQAHNIPAAMSADLQQALQLTWPPAAQLADTAAETPQAEAVNAAAAVAE